MPEAFLSRTINRRLRMRDTFTNILPTYNHEPKTCYIPSFAHHKHSHFVEDMEGRPFNDPNKLYYHKMDEIKTYNESMARLGPFAPKPIKGVTKP